MGSMNKENMIGQKFNKLTVISEYLGDRPKHAKNSKHWLCVCDCGNEKIASTKNLRRGGVRSCGCLVSECKKGLLTIDLTGKKYGLLTVLRKADSQTGEYTDWVCICECGTTIILSSNSLRTGNTKSCGCLKHSKEFSNKISKLRKNYYDKSGRKGIRIHNGYMVFTSGFNVGRSVHDVLMEQIIGRNLRNNECVHHIDCNKLNNDPRNLQLMTKNEHSALHQRLRMEKNHAI